MVTPQGAVAAQMRREFEKNAKELAAVVRAQGENDMLTFEALASYFCAKLDCENADELSATTGIARGTLRDMMTGRGGRQNTAARRELEILGELPIGELDKYLPKED